MPVLIEVCCGSVEDALEAQAGGAQRVELNSSLFFGGLTPSIGAVIEAKRLLRTPVMVMIRPRGGGFRYTEAELGVMERDIELAIAHGAAADRAHRLRPDPHCLVPSAQRPLGAGESRDLFRCRAVSGRGQLRADRPFLRCRCSQCDTEGVSGGRDARRGAARAAARV